MKLDCENEIIEILSVDNAGIKYHLTTDLGITYLPAKQILVVPWYGFQDLALKLSKFAVQIGLLACM